MKKPNANEYYIEQIKKGLSIPPKENTKVNDSPREEIQNELRKSFEKDEEKHYCLF